MKHRGRECAEREFSDGTGIGTEYLLDGIVVRRRWTTRTLSAEEIAAKQAQQANDAEVATRRAALVGLKGKANSGAMTPPEVAQAIELILAQLGI